MCVSCFGDISSTAVLLCMVIHPAARIFRAVSFDFSYQYLAARILPNVLIDHSTFCCVDIYRWVMCTLSCLEDITGTRVLLCHLRMVHPAANICRAVHFVKSHQYILLG